MSNYYIAKIFVRQCSCDFRINDVPILRRYVENDLSSTVPINYLIESSGQQVLSATILPLKDQISFVSEALCQIEIWEYIAGEHSIIPNMMICSIELKIQEGELALPIKEAKQLFHTEVNYRINRWKNCVKLEKSKELSREVAFYFRKIADILSSGKYQEFERFVFKREKDICTSLGLDEREINIRNQTLFDALDNGFVLCPLKGNKLIEYYSDNRIVTIIDSDMNSALRFRNIDTGELLVLDLLLGRKDPNKELCII